MRSMKKLGTAVAATSMFMALIASSASAANWDPANTTLTAHGTLTLTVSPVSVTCTYHSGVRSTGNDVAVTTDAAGTPAGPTFTNCTSSIGLAATAVATPGHAGAWNLTATSTTVVDVTNGNATVNVGGGACIISAMNVSLANNTWSNATSTLVPGSGSFAITKSGPLCPSATTGTMSGSVSAPGASIT